MFPKIDSVPQGSMQSGAYNVCFYVPNFLLDIGEIIEIALSFISVILLLIALYCCQDFVHEGVLFFFFFIPPPNEVGGGVYWIHLVRLSVCPSVRPSVCL